MRKTAFLLIMLAALLPTTLKAQCPLENTAFSSGEYLSYNLYFNWKFVWVKVGYASLSTVSTKYKGQQAFRSSLITRGNGKLDKFFIMRDTLLGYVTPTLSPLYFRKGAEEGDRYYVDEVWYDYTGGKCKLKMHKQNHDKTHENSEKTMDQCVYDMLNLFTRARNFDPTGWQKGHTLKFPMADGSGVLTGYLRYNGREKVKGDNGVSYNCMKLTYMEWSEKKKKYREFATFFVTDDKNHVPVRIDITLNFGNAKAFVTTMKGTRNPLTAITN
ncbi:MAG: DUF3108 domain-containing protein [Prevotella sp.]|nr:DUF3108 domain-containing protein [Prevotella sp.]